MTRMASFERSLVMEAVQNIANRRGLELTPLKMEAENVTKKIPKKKINIFVVASLHVTTPVIGTLLVD